ncbi:sugar ABC transporter permease [Candidatus Bathyarchaeota archaeon ex4484_135]|nr:MAG: sugar ABC transporter permease [Candidatus Bathyarchaeota archaeon ex4484_135]
MFLPITVRVEKRLEIPPWLRLAVPVCSFLVALALASAVFAFQGLNPLAIYGTTFSRIIGTRIGLSFLVVKAIPLLLCAVGLVMAFRAQVWNIGAEGQLLLGAVAAAGLALFVMPEAPSAVLIPAMFLAGFLAGAAWALVPAVLKAKLNVNEVITTLMMNYIAAKLVEYLIYGPWRGKATWGFPFTDLIPGNAVLPTVPGTGIHYPTLMLALLSSGAVFVLMEKTKLGYEVKVFGGNPELAKAVGMRPAKIIIACMLVSGGLAGLAGVGELAGVHKRLMYPESISAGYGYTAIIVAWLARLNPLACVLTALLMGGLLAAGETMRTSFSIPYASVNVFNGLILLCVVAGEVMLRYKVKLVVRRSVGHEA